MSGWPLVPLGEVFDIARGGSPRPIDAFITDAADGINWISISDASDSSKYIERTKRRIRPEGASRSRTVFAGDFLLTNSMSFGRPYIMRTTGCIHDGWLALGKKREGIDHDFFFHLLGSDAVYSEFARLAAGVTVKNLNIELVKGVKVPVPPLPEQRRIAEVLDRAETLRAQRRQALAQLDTLAEAIFLDMFGDPLTNPKLWPKQKLESLGALDRGISKHRPRNDPILLGGTHPLIQTGDVANCDRYIRSFSSTYSDIGLKQSRKWPAGTLCITIAANIAKTGVLTFDACFPDSVVGFKPNEQTTIEYVQTWLSFLQQMLEDSAPESAQKNINLATLRQLDVPLPPLELQKAYGARLAAIEQLKQSQRLASVHLNTLFTSLQHRAFRGEL